MVNFFAFAGGYSIYSIAYIEYNPSLTMGEEMKNYPKSVEALFTDTPGQEEEIIELTDVVNDLAGRQEEIIELTDIIAEPPPLADRESQAFVDLTDEIVPVDKTTGTDPIIELSEIASTAETTAGSDVEDPKFYEPIGEDDVIALVDQISSQIDKDAGSDELPIETLDDAHVAELIDLNEEVDSVIQEPATFTIPRDGSELKPDLPADTFALDDHALKAGMENPDELDFEMMDELAVRLDQDIDGHTSEVAEQLGKAMQETKANEALPAETEEEFSLSLESIRNKLDSVFPDDETTALPNAIGLFETSAQAPPVSEEVDLPELLFPETAPERQPAQALFTGVETETQLSPSIPKTAEPPADMPELHFPEVQFDPDMPQFAYPD
jgi:hypothetical protein